MRNKMPKRKIIHSESAGGEIVWTSMNRNEYNRDDKISVFIRPYVGYMRGIISVSEESSSQPIEYQIKPTKPKLNQRHKLNVPEEITFLMPNDNVKLWVKFVKIL